MECFGQVRINDYERASDSRWKEGSLIISRGDAHWHCCVDFKANKNRANVRRFRLSAKELKRYTCRNKRVSLELANGTTINFINDGYDNTKEFEQLFDEIKSKPIKTSPNYQFSLSKLPATLKTSPKTLHDKNTTPKKYPLLSNPSNISYNNSSSHEESLSDSRRGQKRELDDGKENLKSDWVTTDKKAENHFLNRSAEKSRETLASLKTASFYQNSESRNYGSLNYQRRRPGLLADPEKYKRPRLNSANYTWGQNKFNSQSPQAAHRKHTPLQGFSNLGNTCYMNAILQSLFGLDTLATDLTNRKTVKAMPKESLYSSMSLLLNAKRRPGLTSDQRRQYLRNVKSAISSSAKRFSGHEQHDAHEFLGQVLDQMKEEVLKMNKCTPSPEREKNVSTLLPPGGQEYINPTVMNFEFEVLHTIKCQDCEEEVTNSETFHDLSVDLPRSREGYETFSIQDALDQFFCEEKIEYCCESCGGKSSLVTHKYTRLPRVLILHLKRYSFNMSKLANVKMGRHVHIPKYLTLRSHCLEQTQPPHPPTYSIPSPSTNTSYLSPSTRPSKDTSRKLFSEVGHYSKVTTPNTTGKFNFKRSSLGQEMDRNGSIRKNLLSHRQRSVSESDFQKALHESKREAKKYQKQTDEEKELMESVLNQSMKEAEQEKKDQEQQEQLLADALEISVQESNQLQADIQGFEMASENNSEEIWPKTETSTCQQEPDLSEYNLKDLTEEEQIEMALKWSMSEMVQPAQDNVAMETGNHESLVRERPEFETAVLENSKSNNAIKAEKWIELDDSENTQGFDVSFENTASSSQEDAKNWNDDKLYENQDGKPHTKEQNAPDLNIFEDVCDLTDQKEDSNICNKQKNNENTPQKDTKVRHNSAETYGEKSETTDSKAGDSDMETSEDPFTVFDPKEEVTDRDATSSNNPVEISDEDNKENKTPPKESSSQEVCFDWIEEREEDRRREEEDLNKALKLSLSDCGMTEQEDEDLRKAKELSLQDFNIADEQSECLAVETDFSVERSREELQSLQENAEKGSLPYSYRLVSVVSHMGSSSVSGHYICDVNDIKKKSWSSFDDSEVYSITEKDVRASREKSGYIFFYMDKSIYEDLQDHYRTQHALDIHSALSSN